MTALDLTFFLPELVLTGAIMIMVMIGVFFPTKAMEKMIFGGAIALLVALGLLFWPRSEDHVLFGGLMIDDAYGRYLKSVIMLVSAGVLASSMRYLVRVGMFSMEYVAMILLAVLGMCVMVMATNLLMLYIGLELQSLALYVLAAFRRGNVRSSEAGLKYFVLGALSSGLFLFGAALVYGFTGQLDYSGIAASIGTAPNIGVVFGLAFLAAAMAFKMSLAPFHMWTPDVYQGAPTSVTAFFSTAPKLAAAGMLGRLIYSGFADAVAAWQQILVILAVLSVVVGAVGGVGQTNIKRMLAYSSILNMGFVAMALAAGTADGLAAMLVYLTIYAVASMGSFAVIMSMTRDNREVVDIYELGQLSRRAPMIAAGLGLLMFSTAGIPPLAGFTAKYISLTAAIEGGLTWLAIVAVIASVVGAFYYLRIVYLMYFGAEPASDHERQWSILSYGVFGASALLMLIWMFSLFGIGAAAIAAATALVGG